ncbi:N-acetyltransferase [Eisenbergiella sp. OF01-20]|nr:N-acetyltransferase [Eisenbergiella sp. OF01-20]
MPGTVILRKLCRRDCAERNGYLHGERAADHCGYNGLQPCGQGSAGTENPGGNGIGNVTGLQVNAYYFGGGIYGIKNRAVVPAHGYGISEEYRNKGYVTEAARAVVRYAFEEAGLDMLAAIVKPENTASQCVIKKLGFSRYGVRMVPDENDVLCNFDYFRLYCNEI